MFHYVVEDIPHAVVSLVALNSKDVIMHCSSDVDTFFGQLPISHKSMAKIALGLSLGSIVLGLVSKSMQMIAMTIATSGQDVDGVDSHASHGRNPVHRGSLVAAFSRIEREAPAIISQLMDMVSDSSSQPSEHGEDPDRSEDGRGSCVYDDAARPRDSVMAAAEQLADTDSFRVRRMLDANPGLANRLLGIIGSSAASSGSSDIGPTEGRAVDEIAVGMTVEFYSKYTCAWLVGKVVEVGAGLVTCQYTSPQTGLMMYVDNIDAMDEEAIRPARAFPLTRGARRGPSGAE